MRECKQCRQPAKHCNCTFPDMDDEIMAATPVKIIIMMACYYSPTPEEEIGHDLWSSPSGQDARRWLNINCLIDDQSRATPRGEVWVKAFLAVPLPVERTEWVMPS